MKRLLFWLIILFLAVWVGIIIQSHSGYVLIVLNHISIEMTFWIAVFLLLLSFLVFILLFKILGYIFRFTDSLRNWLSQRQRYKAKNLTHKGLYELAEGEWQKAENALKKSAKKSETPLINYLAAAQASQKQGDIIKRDHYLKQAAQLTGHFEVAVGLTQAQLQLDHHQLEQALATLQHIRQLVPHHAYVLKLLQAVYFQLNDYEALLNLLPDLRRHKILNSKELEKLELMVYEKFLLCAKKDHHNMEKIWQKIPKSLQKRPELLEIYIKHLIVISQNEHAEELLKSVLKKKWSGRLVQLYASIKSKKSSKQLQQAEYWFKSHPNDPALLFTLAKLSIREKLWGKARNYLENCLTIKPSAIVYVELGKLAEQLDKKEEALAYYRQAAMLFVGNSITVDAGANVRK